MMIAKRYPSPKETGGRLMRKVISLCRGRGLALPLDSPVMIAVSGGVDSVALGHLLVKYGRRVIDPSRVTFLHFNHGWRPESAHREAAEVKALAEQLGVRFLRRDLSPPKKGAPGVNWEADARQKRIEVYEEWAEQGPNFHWVLTAHHSGDVAESVVWRFLRGEGGEYESGILFCHSNCLRPFLQVSREEILAYVREEGLVWSEDPTNSDLGQFRAWVRREVFPMLESRFPGLRDRLAERATRSRLGEPKTLSDQEHQVMNLISVLTGEPLNRGQREGFRNLLAGCRIGSRLTLSGGVQLKRMKHGWLIEDPK